MDNLMQDKRSQLRLFQEQCISKAHAASDESVRDLVVAITGGARGLGRVLAKHYLLAGAKVACVDINWKQDDEWLSELSANPNSCVVNADITTHSAPGAIAEAVHDNFDKVDVLVNCAALVSETIFAPRGHRPTLETTSTDWQRMFDVNLFGTLEISRPLIKMMVGQGRGMVINVVSSGVVMRSFGGAFFAARPYSVEMPYQATKAALTTLGFYLAEELRETNVSVNSFMPGHTRGSWFDATARALIEDSSVYAHRPMDLEHVVPIGLFLAGQCAPGTVDPVTGRLFFVPDWNYDHGYGGRSVWGDYRLPEDIDRAYMGLEKATPAYTRSGLAHPTFDAEKLAYEIAVSRRDCPL